MYVVIWAMIYIEIKYSLVMIDNCIDITLMYFTGFPKTPGTEQLYAIYSSTFTTLIVSENTASQKKNTN